MKNKLLKVAVLSCALLLTGCDKIVANPSNGSDNLITFSDGKVYFQNDYQKVYDGLVDSEDFNKMTFQALLDKIVDDKVTKSNFFTDLATLKTELVEKAMLTKLDSDSYKVNKLFSETKFLNSVNSSLYGITVATPHEDVAIKPDTKVSELLGDDYQTTYKAFIDAEVMPDINKNLLTAKYIIQNSFSSLGRAYARRIQYVKLENMKKKPGAASVLINKWLGDFVSKGTTTTPGSFDLDSLARIYKGIAGETAEENAYINSSDYYSLSDEISDEIAKIADYDSATDEYTMKLDLDIDTSIEDKYTSSGTYTLAWGHELALRDLSAKKISDSDLFTKTNGISDLPSAVTDRLFSSSVSSYLKSAYYMEDGSEAYDADGKVKEGAKEVKFLTPLNSENGSELSNYYFYDSEGDAYYIVVVSEYAYTTSKLQDKVTYNASDKTLIEKVDSDVARIALELASSSSYSSDAILDVLDEYKISTNIHDQNFYDYMNENYADIFDK